MTTRRDTIWKSSALAGKYLTGVRGAIPLAKEQLDVMLRLIAAQRKSARRFLDLGCGDGVLAATILAHYPKAKGVLLDFSEAMLRAAKARLAPFAGNVEFVLEDYGQPNWVGSVRRTRPFDVIVSGFSIHHQPDRRKRALYAEIYQLLRPGGIFLNVEHVASPSKWVERRFEDLFIDALQEFNRQKGSAKTTAQVRRQFFRRPDKDANILTPVDLQCDWLRANGYCDVDCYFKLLELAVFGGRRPK